ncbi:50S ribosomal protein L24, partial [Salmonella enterica]
GLPLIMLSPLVALLLGMDVYGWKIMALNQPGGIVEKEAAIQVSNVAIFNAATGKADRVGFRFEDGKKVRFFKSNSETIK